MFCPNLECPDFRDTGRPGEYRETVTVCPMCGQQLVHEPPPEMRAGGCNADVEVPPEEPRVVVATFNFRQDAEMAVAMLRTNGVGAVAAADDCGSVDPALGFGTRTRVLVPESEATLAAELLEGAEVNALNGEE